MALQNESLTAWEIGFRWAGLEPCRRFGTPPLLVRDNFRLMMDAIVRVHLACTTLSSEKWSPDSSAPPEYFVRHHLRAIEDCIMGRSFSRRLLRFALIDRWDFFLWCRRQGIPLPEFWFPPNWKLAYEWPEEPQAYDINGVPVLGETRPLLMEPFSHKISSEGVDAYVVVRESEQRGAPSGGEQQLRHNQRARIACQFVAEGLWRQSPTTTIADMVKHEAIQKYCDGQRYDDATVREWIKVVAPTAVREKRGRPKKQTLADDI